MARRKKKKTRSTAKPAPEKPFHNPFAQRAKELKELAEPAPDPDPRKPAAQPTPPPVSDEELFLRAMGDVAPLKKPAATALAEARPGPPPLADEDLEALTELADLVSGTKPLDVRDTDEYIEGARTDLDPRILVRLAAGQYSVQDHLDLHGLSLTEAKDRAAHFLFHSRRRERRCVLIIHGRGLKSPQGRPVIKPHLIDWLSRSALRKHVLAFATARPYDGGAGAVYVLLKK